ncbi:MAG TPA: YidB family protein [Gaiellales bacterium]
MSSPLEDLLGGLMGGSGGAGGALGSLLGGGSRGGGSPLTALLPVVTGMLAGGGLSKIMSGLQSAGLEDKAKSWIAKGENKPLSADEVKQVVPAEKIAEVAQKAGVSHDDAAGLIAQALPAVVDHVTPDGHVPDDAAVDATLGKLDGAAAAS